MKLLNQFQSVNLVNKIKTQLKSFWVTIILCDFTEIINIPMYEIRESWEVQMAGGTAKSTKP